MRTVLLLLGSNGIMTLAWCGHLRYRSTSPVLTILASWLIALPEHDHKCTELGYRQFTVTQLKILQEVIPLSVFMIFSISTSLKRRRVASPLAFLLIVVAVALAMSQPPSSKQSEAPTSLEHNSRPAPRLY